MINNLKGTYLSNFYERSMFHEGLLYRNAESAFQASKCKNIEQRKEFQALLGFQAKAKGRTVEIVSNWNEVRLEVMLNVVRNKFEQHPDLLAMLVGTKDDQIVEGNYWNDTFWGVCKGKGENHLGLILMQVRNELS